MSSMLLLERGRHIFDVEPLNLEAQPYTSKMCGQVLQNLVVSGCTHVSVEVPRGLQIVQVGLGLVAWLRVDEHGQHEQHDEERITHVGNMDS